MLRESEDVDGRNKSGHDAPPGQPEFICAETNRGNQVCNGHQQTVSLPINVRRLDDGGPASDLVFDQCRERFLPSLRFVRDIATQVRKPTADFLIIQGLVECIAELIQKRSRCALWSK